MATSLTVVCDNCDQEFEGDDEQYFEQGWIEVRTTMDGAVKDFCDEECLVEYFEEEDD